VLLSLLDGTAVAEGLEKVDRLQVALLLESSNAGAEGSMRVRHEPKHRKKILDGLAPKGYPVSDPSSYPRFRV
jgi:hypothetical protein